MVMVWHTSPGLTAGVAAVTVVRALIPAATIWLTKLVIDAVVEAVAAGGTDGSVNRVVTLVVLQLVLALLATALDHGGNTMRTLLGDRFSNRINIMILEKAETLDLAYFEDSKFYDMLERARREANMRPAGLVTNTFQLAGSFIQLLSVAALLLSLAWWILLVVAVTSIPYLGADMWFARARHRLNWRRAPESRRLWYLGYVMTSDETVKEVRLFDLGGHLIEPVPLAPSPDSSARTASSRSRAKASPSPWAWSRRARPRGYISSWPWRPSRGGSRWAT